MSNSRNGRRVRQATEGQRWFAEFEKASAEDRQRMLQEQRERQSAELLATVQRGTVPKPGTPIAAETASEVKEWLQRTSPPKQVDLDEL